MELSNEAIAILRDHAKWLSVLNKIAGAFNTTETTVRRWFAKNDSRLTTVDALKIIEDETGMKQEDILVEKANA